MSFVTGVAINDTDGDNFYDVGEARAGVSVAVTTTGFAAVNDLTETAGGYSAAVNAGSHGVTFSGGGLAASVSVTVDSGSDNAKVDLSGNNKILSSVTTTLGAGAKDLVLLGAVVANGTGNALDNVVTGSRGANTLMGAAGADTFKMSASQLAGSIDIFNGGSEIDTADFSLFSSAVAVDLTVSAAEAKTSDTANAWTTATRTIADFVAVENITGSAFADKLVGDNGANVLNGGAGDDVLDGGAGVDTYVGGLGNDAYYVRHLGLDGRVQDNFTELANQGVDGVNTSVSLNLNEARYVNIENGYIVGTAATNLGGSAVSNVLVGNLAANSIYGLGGRDVMRGEGGADNFVYIYNTDTGKTAATRDVIQDFTTGTDKINLASMDANGALVDNGTFVFLATAGTAFTGVAGQLHYVWEDLAGTANDKTLIEGDFNGDSIADFQIELTGLKSLLATDFVL